MWPVDARDWNDRYSAADLVWSAGPNEFLAAEAAGLIPAAALDIACGEGRNAIWLAERGWSVTAVDFSDVAVDRARTIAAERGVEVDWYVADVETWQAERSFDLVVILYVHLPEAGRRRMLTRAASALAPGGTLLVVAHALRNLGDGFGGPRDPAVLADPADIAADLLAADAALEIEHAQEVERHRDTPEGPQVAIDLIVRARRKLGQE